MDRNHPINLFDDIYNTYKYPTFRVSFHCFCQACFLLFQFFCSSSFMSLSGGGFLKVSVDLGWEFISVSQSLATPECCLLLVLTAAISHNLVEQHLGVGAVPTADLWEWVFLLLCAAGHRDATCLHGLSVFSCFPQMGPTTLPGTGQHSIKNVDIPTAALFPAYASSELADSQSRSLLP